MIIKRCVLCRKFFFSKNVIYVTMFGDDKSGFYCFGCLKGYLLSNFDNFRDYINSKIQFTNLVFFLKKNVRNQ